MLINLMGVNCSVYAITSDDENSDAFRQALYEKYLYNKYYYEEEENFYALKEEILNDNMKKEETPVSIQSTPGGELIAGVNENLLGLKYKIVNTQKPLAIQKTYIGSKYLYFIQKSEKTLYFSRCLLPTSGTTVDASNTSQGKFIRKLNCSGQILTTVEILGSKLGAGSKTEMEGYI